MNKSMLGGMILGIAVATAGAVVAGFGMGGSPIVEPQALVPEVAGTVSSADGAEAAPTLAPAAPVVVAEAVAEPSPAPEVVCREVEVLDESAIKDDKKIAGTAIGAVVGGVVGNAMGKDDGKVATVVGAATGAIAGRVAQDQYQNGKKETRYETVCEEVSSSD